LSGCEQSEEEELAIDLKDEEPATCRDEVHAIGAKDYQAFLSHVARRYTRLMLVGSCHTETSHCSSYLLLKLSWIQPFSQSDECL
jgi:hypothetical protein